MTTLADNLVPDELWALVAPLLPAPPRPPYGGRHHVIPDRACFAAIVYDRLHGPHLHPVAAARPGTWLRFTGDLLAPPGRVGRRRRVRSTPPPGLGPARQARRGGLVARQRGHHERARHAWGDHAWGDQVGANPVDRGKPSSKLHLVCDGGGLPLTAVVTAANVNDTIMFQAVLDDVPPVRTPSGRRRTRPAKVHADKGYADKGYADKGYDSRANRRYLRRRGIRSRIARRGIESSSRLGRHRWRVERSLSWLSGWRRLQVRWDRDAGRWFAFVLLAGAVVCFNRL